MDDPRMTLDRAAVMPVATAVDTRGLAWIGSAVGAVAVPVLFVPNLPPSPTLFNQALALVGWGLFLAVLAAALPMHRLRWTKGLLALHGALALMSVAALASPAWTGQPWATALCSFGMLGAVAFASAIGAAVQQAGLAERAMRAFCVALLLASSMNAGVGLVQIYAPSWLDGVWMAGVIGDGRASGNLRQSNLLCSLLLMGLVGLVWLTEARVLQRSVASLLALVLMFALVLTASRSGVLGAFILAAWGLADKRLNREIRIALLLAPVIYALLWACAAAWASHAQLALSTQTRYSGANTPWSSSRFDVWANSLALIKAHPWLGTGWGEFNFAWSLSEAPVRSGEFFDHAHNLPLHLAVELGLPLAALVLGLLTWSVWQAGRNCLVSSDGEAGLTLRCSFALLVLLLTHSLLEYPLWYAFFSLPAAFAIGMCLGSRAPEDRFSNQPAQAGRLAAVFRPLALLLPLAAGLTVYDYFRVVVIFSPPHNASPLLERIADGKNSWLFKNYARYAEMTVSKDPALIQGLSKQAAHQIMDMRLMIAWANALHAVGDTDRARYIARRLEEFPNAETGPYFAPCRNPTLAERDRPYQCTRPNRGFTFEDFR